MRYQRRVSRVDVVGRGWYGQRMAYSYPLGDYELRGIYDRVEPGYTRHNVEQWLMLNSGDFQSVEDFAVTISDGSGRDFDSEWASEESECLFNDCMYPQEEEA